MRNIQLMGDGKGNDRENPLSSVVSNDYDGATNINKPG